MNANTRRRIVIALALSGTAGVVKAQPDFNHQTAELREIRKRIEADLLFTALAPDSEAYRGHIAWLDAQADALLAMKDGYWSQYADVAAPAVSYNGQAWSAPFTLAKAYASRGSRHHQSEAALKAIEAGLRHLAAFAYPGCPQKGNWWAWQIGFLRAFYQISLKF